MKTRVLMALLLAMMAGLFWWGWRGEGEAARQGSSERASDAASRASNGRSHDRSRDDARRQALADLRADRSAERSADLGEASADPPAAPPDPESAPPSPSASPAALREHLDLTFDQQAADATWSGTARLEVTRKLTALMPAPGAMKSVECRATMCRLEMVYDDLAQYQAFMSRLSPDALPWNGTWFSTPLGDPSVGPVTFVAFLSRDGQQLAVD